MRLRKAVQLARQELRTLNDASKASGGRDALVARSRELLGLGEIEARGAQEVAELEAQVSTRLDELEVRLLRGIEDLEARVSTRLDELAAQTHELYERTALISTALTEARTHLQTGLEGVEHHLRHQALHALVQPVTEWVRETTLDTTPLVSVVLATHNRSTLVRRAIESVQAQVYPHWELVVVDDGSTDRTAELLAELASEDSRIVPVSQTQRGVSAARNAGLSLARGELVCYIDDDNVMQPLWLKAVAWAFERQPDTDLLYGARLTDVDTSKSAGTTGLPFLHFEPFDRAKLESANFIDLGVVAHRRNLGEAIFDESLEALVDWDLVLRLTKERTPLALPVVASHYTTTAPDRISVSGRFAASEAAVRAKLLRDRRLRVLAYNALFPLVPETYIAEEMHALADNGAVLAWCTDRWSPSPVRVAEPTYTDLDAAVADFEPDVVVLFWASFAEQRLDELTRAGKPFAVRVHSFDFDLEVIERVRQHPLCIGIWAYPHHARLIAGAHELVALLNERDAFGEPAEERSIVLSASAALPKKDWPTLVAAFSELSRSGVDCRIAVGTTYLHEDEPQVVRQLIADSGAQVMLSVDVPHDQVIDLLKRTAVVVYTKRPGGPFGMPRSIIEGMYAGTSVIMPDRPEARLTGGPACRIYRNAEDIVRHVTEVMAGGPAVQSERRANRQFAETHFADPSLGAEFATGLAKALSRWRAD